MPIDPQEPGRWILMSGRRKLKPRRLLRARLAQQVARNETQKKNADSMPGGIIGENSSLTIFPLNFRHENFDMTLAVIKKFIGHGIIRMSDDGRRRGNAAKAFKALPENAELFQAERNSERAARLRELIGSYTMQRLISLAMAVVDFARRSGYQDMKADYTPIPIQCPRLVYRWEPALIRWFVDHEDILRLMPEVAGANHPSQQQ
jgi:hypothetical protein